MWIDIRLPIGMLFSGVGIILSVFWAVGRRRAVRRNRWGQCELDLGAGAAGLRDIHVCVGKKSAKKAIVPDEGAGRPAGGRASSPLAPFHGLERSEADASPALQSPDARVGAGFAATHPKALGGKSRKASAGQSSRVRSELLLVPGECPLRRRSKPELCRHVCFRKRLSSATAGYARSEGGRRRHHRCAHRARHLPRSVFFATA